MSGELELAARLAGGIWGHLVGDAAGVPYEFLGPEQIEHVRFGVSGTHHQPPGTWSDDGSLMLALLDSLLDAGFDPEDQARRVVDWYRRGAYTPDGDGMFDIGTTTVLALRALEAGAAAVDAGPTTEMSAGNGSLMRVLPLALVERDLAAETLIEHAHLASRVTHAHPRPQAACALYVLVARELLHGAAPPDALLRARTILRTFYEGAEERADHRAALDHLEGWTERQGRGRVWDSFWSAWDAFAGASSFRDAVERAITYGNDTDTTAALAGGLAGIHWGYEGIPAEWVGEMRGREIVRPLVDRLLHSAGYRTSTWNPIRVFWVDLAGAPRLAGMTGALGMTFLPGKQRLGTSGRHWRDVEADASRLRRALAVDAVLLLTEDAELEAAHASGLVPALERQLIEVIRVPIVDGSVPADRAALRRALDVVLDRLADGRRVAVTCTRGLGRSGTVVACLLRDGGLGPDAAIGLARDARKGAIQTPAQEAYVRDWEWPDRPIPRRAAPVEGPGTARRGEIPTTALRADLLPSPWEGFSDDALRFALSFNGYRHVGGGPAELRTEIIEPALEALGVAGRLPDWFTIDDARALLFGLARVENLGEGYVESPAGLHLAFAAVDLIRAELHRRLA